MPRIRSIKPDFFLHDGLAELSAHHRLLFIGLWTQADADGRMADHPRRLKAAIFPYEEVDVDRMLTDLGVSGFILRYSSSEKRFIQVLNFAKHQNPHPKETRKEIPEPTADQLQAAEKNGQQQASRVVSGSLSLVSGSLIPVPMPAVPAVAIPDPDEAVYLHWRSEHAPKASAGLTKKRRDLIRARRKELPAETAQQDLLNSISGWKNDPWPDRRHQLALKILLRDEDQVVKGLSLFAQGRPRPANSVGRAEPAPPIQHPPCAYPGCLEPGATSFDGTATRGCMPHAMEWIQFVFATTRREPDASDADEFQSWLKARGDPRCTT